MRTSFTIALAVGLLGFSVAPVQAQEDPSSATVSGRVVDATTGAPIWGAFVSLPDSDRGFLTDSIGRFDLPVSERTAYVLVAEQLGYADATLRIDAVELGGPVEIRLRPDPVALDELRVLGDRFQRERRAFPGSVRALDFRDLQRAPGQTAFDALMSLGVAHRLRPCGRGGSEEWCVVRRGQVQPVRVIIDEVPVVFGGLDWLRSYDAGEIYLMEVYEQGRAIRVLTRWAVDERAEHLAALRMLPVAPLLGFRGRSGRSLGWGDAGPPVFSRGSRPGSLGLTDFD